MTRIFGDLDELYSAVRDLRLELIRGGEHAWAERIARALDGSVGGEILPRLRHELRALRRSNEPTRLRLTPAIDDMLLFLDAHLGPSRLWPRSLFAPIRLKLRTWRARRRAKS
jgi:hypothetical protein